MNKYSKWYNHIVERARFRITEDYTETHHIQPRSLGGSDEIDNLVALTAREHFICHWLLTKMTTGGDKAKMIYALNGMKRSNKFAQRYETKITARVYENLKKFDKQYSKEKGWPQSVRLTTVQPSGTLSLLPGVTPGIHPSFASYYIRRVRFGSADPLVDACRKRGYKVVWDVGLDGREDHTRYVVEFPCKSPEGSVLANQMTAIEQLEWVKKMQTIWADNAVSVTVYYRKEELPEMKKWLSENYDDSVKSVSFLLHVDHNFPLPPYEEIDKNLYDKMVASIDFSIRLNGGSGVDEIDIDNCGTGSCPVK